MFPRGFWGVAMRERKRGFLSRPASTSRVASAGNPVHDVCRFLPPALVDSNASEEEEMCQRGQCTNPGALQPPGGQCPEGRVPPGAVR
jgi:hypothetical protein